MRIGATTHVTRTARRTTLGAASLLAITLLAAGLYFCRHGVRIENLFYPYYWRFGPGYGGINSHQQPPQIPKRDFKLGPIVINLE